MMYVRWAWSISSFSPRTFCMEVRAESRSVCGCSAVRAIRWEENQAALCVSQPGMGESRISGTPETAASVEERPPGLVRKISQARIYSAMRGVLSRTRTRLSA